MARASTPPSPVAKSNDVVKAANMFKAGYRHLVIAAELKMSTGRLTDIRNELVKYDDNDLQPFNGGGSLPSAASMIRKFRLIDVTIFVKCLLARFNVESGGQSILNEPVSVELITRAYRDYIHTMCTHGEPSSVELENRLSINEAWVLSRDVSLNLVRIYECPKCKNHRLVHEDQRINSNCPYC